MTAVYLIRHGQASFGQENYDQLSDLGHQQSIRLGQALNHRAVQFDAVYLGSMLRHKQTAENCLTQFGVTFGESNSTVDAGWNEYDHQDVLRQFRPEFSTAKSMMEFIGKQDNPKRAFEDDFNAAVERWISGAHDGDYVESWDEFCARVKMSFEATLKASADKNNVAVFTSGGPISLVSQALLGVPQRKIMKMNWTLVNCGVTKIVATGSRHFLSSLNEHTHFEGTDKKHLITYS